MRRINNLSLCGPDKFNFVWELSTGEGVYYLVGGEKVFRQRSPFNHKAQPYIQRNDGLLLLKELQ